MSLKFCSLSSGSSGNCYLVGSDSTFVLIDAGISAKKITDGLRCFNLTPEDLSGILVTHEHTDHIKGIDVFTKKNKIPVHANYKTANQLPSVCKNTEMIDMKIFNNHEEFSIGDLKIYPFPVFHDAVDTVGFSVSSGKHKLSTVTDTGCIDDDIFNEISTSDLIVLEANHDEDMLKMGKYPWFLKQRILSDHGHLSNEAAGEAIANMYYKNPKKRRFLLAHLSRENNFPEMAYQTIRNILEKNQIFTGKGIDIDLLKRDALSGVYVL